MVLQVTFAKSSTPQNRESRMNNTERDKLIFETHEHVTSMSATMKAHLDNKVIHEVPPCEAHKSLANKLWAVGMLSFSTALGLALKWMTEK